MYNFFNAFLKSILLLFLLFPRHVNNALNAKNKVTIVTPALFKMQSLPNKPTQQQHGLLQVSHMQYNFSFIFASLLIVKVFVTKKHNG